MLDEAFTSAGGGQVLGIGDVDLLDVALAMWDHLFGTAHASSGFPERYGIGDAALDGDDYPGHVLSPLTRQALPQLAR